MKTPGTRLYASAQAIVLLFVVLLLSSPVHAVVDLSTERLPPATQALQMRLQFDLAKVPQPNGRKSNFVHSTHLTFATNLANPSDGEPTLSDGQLFQMGCDAWDGMIANRAQYGLGTTGNRDFKPPGIIAVMLVDNEIFITSTLKGPSFLYKLSTDLHTDVQRSLRFCDAVMHQYANPEGNPRTLHQNGAGWAEPMAVSQYYVAHPVSLLYVHLHHASQQYLISDSQTSFKIATIAE